MPKPPPVPGPEALDSDSRIVSVRLAEIVARHTIPDFNSLTPVDRAGEVAHWAAQFRPLIAAHVAQHAPPAPAGVEECAKAIVDDFALLCQAADAEHGEGRWPEFLHQHDLQPLFERHIQQFAAALITAHTDKAVAEERDTLTLMWLAAADTGEALIKAERERCAKKCRSQTIAIDGPAVEAFNDGCETCARAVEAGE